MRDEGLGNRDEGIGTGGYTGIRDQGIGKREEFVPSSLSYSLAGGL